MLGFIAMGCSEAVDHGGRPAPTAAVHTSVSVGLFTDLSGAAYRSLCVTEGVPLPDAVMDPADGWLNHGEIIDPFLSPELEGELWSWASTDPAGMCLALPRWRNDDKAAVFGVICMGFESGKACFFDNPSNTHFARGQPHPFDEWIGGADLVANNQGVCSDCHAGENPFVVHPEKAAFADMNNAREMFLVPRTKWHEPIVPLGWPSNPGPTRRLDPVTAQLSCNMCHEIPEISNQLPGYCGTVLTTAVTRATETMPPSFLGPATPYADLRARFEPHFSALLNDFCQDPPPGDGGIIVLIDHEDDPDKVSPIRVAEPLYACARGVTVLGAVPRATVELYLNGALAGLPVVATPSGAGFLLPDGLAVGDVLTARQIVGGVASAMSAPAVVVEYPDATLPTPIIDPDTVYACANTIGVITVPGALLEVWQNGGDKQAVYTQTGSQIMNPGPSPWDLNDAFTAKASLCEKESAVSGAVVAVQPPASLRQPRFDPVPHVGMEYFVLRDKDYGTFATIERTAPALLALGETCDSPGTVGCYFDLVGSPLGRGLVAGETLTAEPSLRCPGAPPGLTTTTDEPLPCDDLPAPEVSRPSPGQDFLVVNRAFPGARIYILDALGNEIGDGAGSVVRLVPPRTFVLGELITVVQQVGTCMGKNGFRIAVGQGG